MREIVSIALVVGLVFCVPFEAAAEGLAPTADPNPDQQARTRLSDLLFSDVIDRIDFQATTFEEGKALIDAAANTILEMGVPILGDATDTASRGGEIITALNSSHAKGMYSTFGKDKQTIFVRDDRQARMLGEVVGKAMAIIYKQYGSGGISYQNKAEKLFKHVRVDPDEDMPMLNLYLDTVEFVEKLPSGERQKYFR
jgi:hypothetical protein